MRAAESMGTRTMEGEDVGGGTAHFSLLASDFALSVASSSEFSNTLSASFSFARDSAKHKHCPTHTQTQTHTSSPITHRPHTAISMGLTSAAEATRYLSFPSSGVS
jgi:hypothetical protein